MGELVKDVVGEIDYGAESTWLSIAGLLGESVVPRSSNNCGRWECGPGWRWRMTLPDFDLWYVTKGRGRLVVQSAGLSRDVSPGLMALLRPGDVVAADQDPENPLTVLAVHVHFVDRVTGVDVEIPGGLLPRRFVDVRDPGSLELQMSRLVRLDARRDPLSRIESSNLIQEVLIRLYRQDAENQGIVDIQGSQRFDRLIGLIDQAPQEWMSVGQAAEHVGLSADYFSRLFANEFGTGFRTFCLRRRLDRAHRLIQETDLTVGEVAEALGYSDVSLMSRQFKERFGVSPKQSRRAITG